MSDEDKNYIGDNIRIRLYMEADLSNATSIIYHVKKPDPADETQTEEVDWTAGVEDTLEGVVYYDTTTTSEDPLVADLDVKGIYLVQAEAFFNDGTSIRSKTTSFYIHDLWE